MPPLGEEAGKTARSVVDAFKGTPGMLAMVMFNVLFMGMVIYIQHQNGERWQTLLEQTLKQCAPR